MEVKANIVHALTIPGYHNGNQIDMSRYNTGSIIMATNNYSS